MEAVVAVLSSTVSLCIIVSVLVIAVIVAIIVFGITLKGIKNSLGYCQTSIEDITEDIQNVARASKRIERMSDAVNQRTKAHLISKDVKNTKSQNTNNKSKTKNIKQSVNNKKGGNKNAYLFKSVKKTTDYSFTDNSVDYD